jgi:hypothetical protein
MFVALLAHGLFADHGIFEGDMSILTLRLELLSKISLLFKQENCDSFIHRLLALALSLDYFTMSSAVSGTSTIKSTIKKYLKASKRNFAEEQSWSTKEDLVGILLPVAKIRCGLRQSVEADASVFRNESDEILVAVKEAISLVLRSSNVNPRSPSDMELKGMIVQLYNICFQMCERL